MTGLVDTTTNLPVSSTPRRYRRLPYLRSSSATGASTSPAAIWAARSASIGSNPVLGTGDRHVHTPTGIYDAYPPNGSSPSRFSPELRRAPLVIYRVPLTRATGHGYRLGPVCPKSLAREASGTSQPVEHWAHQPKRCRQEVVRRRMNRIGKRGRTFMQSP